MYQNKNIFIASILKSAIVMLVLLFVWSFDLPTVNGQDSERCEALKKQLSSTEKYLTTINEKLVGLRQKGVTKFLFEEAERLDLYRKIYGDAEVKYRDALSKKVSRQVLEQLRQEIGRSLAQLQNQQSLYDELVKLSFDEMARTLLDTKEGLEKDKKMWEEDLEDENCNCPGPAGRKSSEVGCLNTEEITVYKKVEGGILPLANAKVTLPGDQVRTTDANGVVTVNHNYTTFETITISVKAEGYKPISTTIPAYGSGDSIGHHSITLEPEGNVGGDYAKWTGTYIDETKRMSVSISADTDGNLTGSYNYDFPSTFHNFAKGSGNFSNCVKKEETLEFAFTCHATGTHADNDKTINTAGTIYLTLSLLRARKENGQYVSWEGIYESVKVAHRVDTAKASVSWKGDGQPKYAVEVFTNLPWNSETFKRARF